MKASKVQKQLFPGILDWVWVGLFVGLGLVWFFLGGGAFWSEKGLDGLLTWLRMGIFIFAKYFSKQSLEIEDYIGSLQLTVLRSFLKQIPRFLHHLHISYHVGSKLIQAICLSRSGNLCTGLNGSLWFLLQRIAGMQSAGVTQCENLSLIMSSSQAITIFTHLDPVKLRANNVIGFA